MFFFVGGVWGEVWGEVWIGDTHGELVLLFCGWVFVDGGGFLYLFGYRGGCMQRVWEYILEVHWDGLNELFIYQPKTTVATE